MELPCPPIAAPPLAAAPWRIVTKADPPWCHACRHRGTRAFVDLPEVEIGLMAEVKRAHAIASAGEVLSRQGQQPACHGVLYSGMAARYRSYLTGERQLLDILLAGDLLGFDSAPDAASWCTVEALTDVSVCLFDADSWRTILSVPSLAARLDERRLAELQGLGERLATVGACDPATSLARFIVDLHRRLRVRGLALATAFTLPLTRAQLGEAIGVTRVHLHRLLRDLRSRGLMTLTRRRVTILDAGRLHALAGSPDDLPPPLPLL